MAAATSFACGANLPWINYGHDVGAAWTHDGLSTPETARRARDALRALKGSGGDVVRWFLFADGRALDADTGLTDLARADLSALFALLDEAGVDVVLVLFDFHMLDHASDVEGVRVGGRAPQLRHPAALVDALVRPLARAVGGEPRLRAWEVMNEPEWALDGRWFPPGETVSADVMQAFVAAVADGLRAESDKPVTVGSASIDDLRTHWTAGNSLARLDFLEVHDYAWGAPPSVDELDVDVPVLIGELPSAGADVATAVTEARALGYAGAWPWSLAADDDASDARRALAGLAGCRDVGR